MCETLYYHCIDNSKYIYDLQRALEETGFKEVNEGLKFEYKLKKDFVESNFYKNGKLFVNSYEEKPIEEISKIPDTFAIMTSTNLVKKSSVSKLYEKIEEDNFIFDAEGYAGEDELGEFDFSQGSGWMYSINGTLYEGTGMSGYKVRNGITIYVRFTLSYGKDIGGYSSVGGTYGSLSTYCGRWLNGQYIDEHRWGQPQQTAAPDCTHPGEMSVTCQVCGDTKDNQELPALGHDFVETERREDTIVYVCSRCGERKEEPIP